MTRAVYPALVDRNGTQAPTRRSVDNAMAAAAEGYPFPTNLDRRPARRTG